MRQQVDSVVRQVKANEKDGIARLIEWLRIPSVSTDPAYRGDVRRAAEWCAAQLREAGLNAELHETGTKENPGHPIVWATHDGPANYTGPHVLFYGHYDVQPPDPLNEWESGPFDPVIRPAHQDYLKDPHAPGERIVARGAVDDKGQVATFLEALRAWKQTAGGPPVKLSVLIEGEEESGSANLERYCRERAHILKQSHICVVSDTGMLGRGKPAITYGVRGLSYCEVILHAANQDLHSGLWGGRCPNPISELAKVLWRLWDADRRVTIPGFYDKVRPIAESERRAWKALGVDSIAALRGIGLPPEADVGEAGYTAVEREWGRPTAEINGIYGGYQAPGAKTVIPAKAGAKVSFRLVADQDPADITDKFRAWIFANTPAGCRWEFIAHSGGWPGTVSSDSPFLAAASRAIEGVSGHAPALIKSGGSIPVIGMLKDVLGLDTLMVGFGLEDDRVHSPNEKFELDCYRLGCATHVRLMAELAQVAPTVR